MLHALGVRTNAVGVAEPGSSCILPLRCSAHPTESVAGMAATAWAGAGPIAFVDSGCAVALQPAPALSVFIC